MNLLQRFDEMLEILKKHAFKIPGANVFVLPYSDRPSDLEDESCKGFKIYVVDDINKTIKTLFTEFTPQACEACGNESDILAVKIVSTNIVAQTPESSSAVLTKIDQEDLNYYLSCAEVVDELNNIRSKQDMSLDFAMAVNTTATNVQSDISMELAFNAQ